MITIIIAFADVIFYGNQKDLTLQKRSQGKKGYVFSSDTLVITTNDETYTDLFPHSGKNRVVLLYNIINEVFFKL